MGSNYTKLMNTKYSNIGDVTVHFDDRASVTHNINQIDSGDWTSPSVGTYFDQDSSRTPVKITILGGTHDISDLPVAIDYTDSLSGKVSFRDCPTYIGGYEIWTDE